MEVPYGINSDDLAIFAGSPHAHIQQDDKAWEKVKKEHDLFPFLEGVGGGEGLRDLIQIKGPRVPGFFFYTPLGGDIYIATGSVCRGVDLTGTNTQKLSVICHVQVSVPQVTLTVYCNAEC